MRCCDESAWSTRPFEPVTLGENLHGRGAADMKSGLAAMIVAIEEFLESGQDHRGSHDRPRPGAPACFVQSDYRRAPFVDGRQFQAEVRSDLGAASCQ